MPIAETWLLPDGVADVLPEQAAVIEQLRRKMLDYLAQRGYQLIYTPFIEYIESLSPLTTLNQDLDLITFKVIDQLTGRLLGIRADITPQVARIDAHVRRVEGVVRYCYSGTILHTQPKGLNASRTPLQLGAELFGHQGIDADLEMIDTMLGIVSLADYTQGLHLDLGHVGLFRSLVKLAQLDETQEQALSELYQRKALPELLQYTQDLKYGQDFYHLGRYASDITALQQHLSADILNYPAFYQAFTELKNTVQCIEQRWPNVSVGVDAVELRSYHYHTGLMFAVYAPNHAIPLAQGGRYDGIGHHFGRSRPATGFSCDVYRLAERKQASLTVVVAPAGSTACLLASIAKLREQGYAVVQLLGNDRLDSIFGATHQLVECDGEWQLHALSSTAV